MLYKFQNCLMIMLPIHMKYFNILMACCHIISFFILGDLLKRCEIYLLLSNPDAWHGWRSITRCHYFIWALNKLQLKNVHHSSVNILMSLDPDPFYFKTANHRGDLKDHTYRLSFNGSLTVKYVCPSMQVLYMSKTQRVVPAEGIWLTLKVTVCHRQLYANV